MAGKRIDDSEIKQYRREGFLKFDLVEMLGAGAFAGLCAAFADAEPRALRPENSNGPLQRLEGLRFEYEEVDAVVRAPQLGELAARLAGVEHVRVWVDGPFIKPPGVYGTGWHQDLPSYPMDRRGLMHIWVAMEDVSIEMGACQYLSRSHRLGPLGRGANYDVSRWRGPQTPRPANGSLEQLLREDDWEVVGEVVCMPLRAGEAIVHDGLLVHGSLANRSDRIRRGWVVAYFPADTQYTGMPRKESDGLGLEAFKPFDHPRFPIIV